jgi:hypothetical protein
MKRIFIFAAVSMMILASIGGCWPWWNDDGRGGRGERYEERERGHDRDHRYEERR